MTEIYNELNDCVIRKIVKIIDNGGIACIPTETVYAMIADASNDDAVQRIYDIKRRCSTKPLSVLVSDISQAKRIVCFNDWSNKLAMKFMPGPITIVLKINDHNNLSKKINEDLGTVGVRMPNHISSLKIIKAIGRPVIGTSANLSGENEDSLNPEKLISTFKDKVDIILDEGKTLVGLHSTVVDLSGNVVKILRPGAIEDDKIFSTLGFCSI